MKSSDASTTVRDYFQNRFTEFGGDVRVLWNSKESQEHRYIIFKDIGITEGASVCDVACGYGDFYHYLTREGLKPSKYTGYDITPEIVEKAKQNVPGGTFHLADIRQASLDGTFDYVFSSGLFFFPLDDWNDDVVSIVRKMYDAAGKAVGINFLSKYSRNPDDVSYYADPSEVLKLMQDNITYRVTLRHDYRWNDFTVYLFKE